MKLCKGYYIHPITEIVTTLLPQHSLVGHNGGITDLLWIANIIVCSNLMLKRWGRILLHNFPSCECQLMTYVLSHIKYVQS